jgi:uncharacterized membrane protein (UPF0127 family)
MLLITLCSVALLTVGFVWMMLDLKKESVVVNTNMLPLTLLEVGTRQIPVELAEDNESRMRGLSYRDSLDSDRGMYFVFASSSVQYFWMHKMNFPLDIVFINKDKIISISSDVPNPKGMTPPAIVSSRGSADCVLEINAGKAAEWGLKVGDVVKLVGESVSR